MYAIFNNEGEYLYITDSEPIDSNLKSKYLGKRFTIGLHRYTGDFETGRVVSIRDSNNIILGEDRKAVVDKSRINKKYIDYFESKYNLLEAICIIANTIQDVKNNTKDFDDSAFDGVRSSLNTIVTDYKSELKSLEAADNIIIVDDIEKYDSSNDVNREFSEFECKLNK